MDAGTDNGFFASIERVLRSASWLVELWPNRAFPLRAYLVNLQGWTSPAIVLASGFLVPYHG